MAVKSIVLPGQMILPGSAEISTEGTSTGFTTMIMEFDVAVAGEAQSAVEVMMQLTTSPFESVELVKRTLLLPAGLPFINH